VNLVQLYKALGGGWEAVFPDESETSVAALPPAP
jgi:outer membrane protein TolC